MIRKVMEEKDRFETNKKEYKRINNRYNKTCLS